MQKEKGVSLIITFFIMIIILAVVLSVSVILYSEVKVIRNIGNSVVSFYAGESGIEKVLYYDRQVLPNNNVTCASNSDCTSSPYTSCVNKLCTVPLSRGLCSIPTSCKNDLSINSSGEHSIYCNGPCSNNSCSPAQSSGGSGCDPITCNNCTITFNTSFSSTNGRTYYVTATGSSPNPPYLNVQSSGTFVNTKRKIEVNIQIWQQ